MSGGHLKVAVRALVEHCLRTGDLVIEQWDPVGTLEAIRAHRHVQQSRPPHYRPEVPIEATVELGGWTVAVEGRIDGVYQEPEGIRIEEIKTTRRSLDELRVAQPPVHWGQAMVYSHLYHRLHAVPVLETRLVYCHLDSLETVELNRSFSAAELESFFEELVSTLVRQREELIRWRAVRNASISNLGFPYEAYRPGQRELAISVYRSLRDHSQLLIQAPTGIGKTMAAVFPSVKALGEGKIEKVLFLTARGTGQEAAARAVADLQDKGLHLRWLQLTAKEKTCFNPDRSCTGEDCSYARGYYDRVGAALQELGEAEVMDRSRVESVARRHTVCPFELSLNALSMADLVVCDYNYAFDPRAFLRRVFEEESSRPAILVDEAHNLVDRAREMFSAVLTRQSLIEARQKLAGLHRPLTAALGRVTAWMARSRDSCVEAGGRHVAAEAPLDLIPLLRNYLRISEAVLARVPTSERERRETLLDLHFEIHRFLRVAEFYDQGFVCTSEVEGRDFRIKLLCLDPSAQLRQRLSGCDAAVFLSATLTPGPYFREVFGCREDAGMIYCPSPFPPENLLVLVADRISTVYRQRRRTRQEVAEMLLSMIRARTGNYLVFFPSFEYLSLVAELLLPEALDFQVQIQEPAMEVAERTAFLEGFQAGAQTTTVGLAVMGGIFGESIDLVGDRLTGAAIVGVGLPGISPERDLVEDYYRRKHGRGYDYAYTYPGINRVLQAAGRVIRTERDRGVVLLIDERYAQQRYRRLLPLEWRPEPVRTPSDLQRRLTAFWSSHAEAVTSGQS